ncbi:GNAT family N-acetyltransferase [Roseomonas sp. CAU 1739]|uniref:GNAT family N-acetyltransferase n=1 Tax=Roseomonas sp. CAU 1739 TaxID=3140364 RepID=UPI00325B3860
MTSLAVRDATPADVPTIARFVRALAEYEKLAHEVTGTEADYHAAIFSSPPRAGCLIADIDGEAAGMALYHWTFSTFLARHGRWLEDLWVEPQFRRRGIAKALFAELAKQTLAEGGKRLAWNVLDWNTPAIATYDAMGADTLKEWITRRLAGDALRSLAAEAR